MEKLCQEAARLQNLMKNMNDSISDPTYGTIKSKGRHFECPYDDYMPSHDRTVGVNGKLHHEFLEMIQHVSSSMLQRLNCSLNEMDRRDYTVYTGSSGIALLYFLLARRLEDSDYLKMGVSILEKVTPRLKNRELSFMLGDAGPLAVCAVMRHHLGQVNEATVLVERLESMLPKVLSVRNNLSDEVLYGRAGYLYALLFCNKYIGPAAIDESVIKDVVSAIINSGKVKAKRQKLEVPLMYSWYQEFYLGAAHGLSGILYMLLQAREFVGHDDLEHLVRPTVEYLQTLALPSGNFPSALGRDDEKFVQWCHGAPGMVDLFTLAYKVFKDKRYLKTALRCGDVVWERGILTKSYGLCHGVAGNAYTFLSLFNATKNPTHLYRACKFAEWCSSYGKHQTRVPDTPLSLFEGMAGAIYFLIDLQKPEDALFPAFGL